MFDTTEVVLFGKMRWKWGYFCPVGEEQDDGEWRFHINFNFFLTRTTLNFAKQCEIRFLALFGEGSCGSRQKRKICADVGTSSDLSTLWPEELEILGN